MTLSTEERAAITEVTKQSAKWLGKQEFSNIMQVVMTLVMVGCFGFTAGYLIPEERKAYTEMVNSITSKNNITDEHQEQQQTKQLELVVGIVNKLLGKMEEVESKLGLSE